MTYGPPPNNQNWQQPQGYGPPPQQPGYYPQQQGYGPPPGYGPMKPKLPGAVVWLGVVAMLFALTEIAIGPGGSIASLTVRVIAMLVTFTGGIMVLNRQRAGAILITIGSALTALTVLLLVVAPGVLGFWIITGDLGQDWKFYARAAVALVLLVWSLVPPVTKALTGKAGPQQPPPGPQQPPPGYQQPPPGYQQPPTWR